MTVNDSDVDKVYLEVLDQEIKDNWAPTLYEQELFALSYVKHRLNGNAAYKEVFPDRFERKTVATKVEKLLKRKGVVECIDQIKREAAAEAVLTAGKIIREHWTQYNKYKDKPLKWQAALAHLKRLGDFVIKTDSQKLPESTGSNTVIILPAQSAIGTAVKQIDHEEIPADLLPESESETQEPETND